MTTVARPSMRASSDACTTASLVESSAEVASSSSSSRGSLLMARAMATRCFCPPLMRTPFSPGRVAYPSGRLRINAFARSAAAIAASSDAPGRPYLMFSMSEQSKRMGSCSTKPIWRRSQRSSRARKSVPSRSSAPCCGS
mmetsp:Transcript_14599/g.47604  ORF Transcript_14599/g.47604 Transcript_14599/m.47604 type:complete len:140 (-) Transcript_14599:116-535(-)